MMLLLALTHMRGLLMFFLVAPIILARPIGARSVWWRATRFTDVNSAESVGAVDPIPRYFQMRPIVMPAICLLVATLATVYSWRYTNSGPPGSIAPQAAIDFVKRNGISGNVFNSYNFGGYLIFSGIPTFVDGRTPPYTDEFLRRYFDAVSLTDISDAFRLLDEYKVRWVLLEPDRPLAKALAGSPSWNEVYSDNYSVVFVRR
jgi:hypothetical protein